MLGKTIVKVLNKWNSKNYDSWWWNGYSTLLDEVNETVNNKRYTLKHLKNAMKKLKENDIVKYTTTFDDEGLISGKGYYIVDNEKAKNYIKKYNYCSECNEELTDEFYIVGDNFLQLKYFDEKDGSDNAFCSEDCICRHLTVMNVENIIE